MPRSLVYSNGRLLVAFDDSGRIRDLFWPRIGQWNHLSGYAVRFGYQVDGRFVWVDSAGHLHQRYGSDIAGEQWWVDEALALEFRVTEALLPEEDRFSRQVTIYNRGESPRTVHLFSTHDFRINESDIGDTAFFHAASGSLVHYKDKVFLRIVTQPAIDQYSCGLKGFNGFEGTWRDAEDGELQGNAIAQGSVDSTARWTIEVPANSEMSTVWQIAAADNLDDVLKQSLPTLIPSIDEPEGDAIQRQLHLSIRMLEAHCDQGGAVIAAIDSDIMETNRANYAYSWPRDGALVALTLDRVGRGKMAKRFFTFCQRLISPKRPFLLQKYHADGALGATWHPWVWKGEPQTPFQQDESALTLFALGEYGRRHPDDPELPQLFEGLAAPLADHMVTYRNSSTGLPLPSYDLWEERRGTHAFTVAAVIAGLRSAAALAGIESIPASSLWEEVADEVEEALCKHLFDQDRACWLRGFDSEEAPDHTVDASTLMIGLLGVGTKDMARANYRAVCDALAVRSPIAGFARYSGDYYFRTGDAYPGNPWIITTLWVARTAHLLGEEAEARHWLEWTIAHATPTGMLPEQIHPDTGKPLSVSPLTWSHAEFVEACLEIAADD